MVLFRIAANNGRAIRVFSAECAARRGRPSGDLAGGRAARPTAWRSWSRSRRTAGGAGDNVMDGAVTAIALHRRSHRRRVARPAVAAAAARIRCGGR